jgi:hypothetical protein
MSAKPIKNSPAKLKDGLTKRNGYPYILHFIGGIKVLLWVDGGEEKDYCLTLSDGSILVTESLDDLEHACISIENLTLHLDEISEIDIEQFWKKVNGIRKGRASSTKTCSILLGGWNLFEDIAYSLNLSQDFPIFQDKILSTLYQKLLAGNNLQAITPEGCGYNPVWTQEEVSRFKPAIRELWQHLIHILPKLKGA